MKINEFQLERYFGIHEFTAKYLLSSSDCDGFSMQQLLSLADEKELTLWNNLTLGYTESQGHPLLREAILKYYQLHDINQVVVASPGELNFIAMNIILEPGDHAICVAPSYQSLYEVVRSIPSEISYWKPSPTDWTFDPAELENLVQSNTKLLIINFPHNPTGAYLSKAELNQVIAFARKHDLYLFSDEMYHKLCQPTTEELPPVCDLYEKGISLWGTSKTFGLAGLRIGWLVSQDTIFLKKVVAFKDYLSICSNAPSEILSIMALNHLEALLQVNMEKINTNISLFTKFAKEQDLFGTFIPPRAGSTSFIELNIEESSKQFSDQLVEKTGIMTVPGEMFNYEGKFIRVGFGRQLFPEALAQLVNYL